jgi:hypothetical protein
MGLVVILMGWGGPAHDSVSVSHLIMRELYRVHWRQDWETLCSGSHRLWKWVSGRLVGFPWGLAHKLSDRQSWRWADGLPTLACYSFCENISKQRNVIFVFSLMAVVWACQFHVACASHMLPVSCVFTPAPTFYPLELACFHYSVYLAEWSSFSTAKLLVLVETTSCIFLSCFVVLI